MTEAMRVRAAWESFYVIVGSSGGALIGLQFVVITLLPDRRHQTTPGGLNAFATHRGAPHRRTGHRGDHECAVSLRP